MPPTVTVLMVLPSALAKVIVSPGFRCIWNGSELVSRSLITTFVVPASLAFKSRPCAMVDEGVVWERSYPSILLSKVIVCWRLLPLGNTCCNGCPLMDVGTICVNVSVRVFERPGTVPSFACKVVVSVPDVMVTTLYVRFCANALRICACRSCPSASTSQMVKTTMNRASMVVVVRVRCRPMLRRAIFVLTFQVRGTSTITMPTSEAANSRIPNTGSTRYSSTDAAIPTRIRARYLRSKCSGTGSLLSVFFGLVVFVVSKLPVPEHFDLRYLALILGGMASSVLLYLVLPVFGIVLFAASLVGIVIVLVPRTWKVSTKMALRNIGRQRTRTTTTMLALFIGVFTIGLVLALGQDLQAQIRNAFAQNLTYNVVTMTSGTDTTALQARLGTVPGLSKARTDTFPQIVPTAIDGQPLQQVLPTSNSRHPPITFLRSMQAYDLSQPAPSLTIT